MHCIREVYKLTWARFSKHLALVLSTNDVMIDLSVRPMYPEIGNCDLFSDARRKTCYERGTISITYSKRLSIFPLQTGSKRYPCEFAFPIRRWRKDARSRPLLDAHARRRKAGVEPPRRKAKYFILKSLDIFHRRNIVSRVRWCRFCQ